MEGGKARIKAGITKGDTSSRAALSPPPPPLPPSLPPSNIPAPVFPSTPLLFVYVQALAVLIMLFLTRWYSGLL
jgi:hypothetical protein